MSRRWAVTLVASGLLAVAAYVSAKPMIPTPADTPVLGELEPVLVKLLGKGADADASLGSV